MTKKILSILLALVLTLSLATPALAATNYTISVSHYDTDTGKRILSQSVVVASGKYTQIKPATYLTNRGYGYVNGNTTVNDAIDMGIGGFKINPDKKGYVINMYYKKVGEATAEAKAADARTAAIKAEMQAKIKYVTYSVYPCPTFSKGAAEQGLVMLQNSIKNECLMQFRFVDSKTRETYYTSDYIAPGKNLNYDKLDKTDLAKGKYNILIYIDTFDPITMKKQNTNGVKGTLTIK